VFLQTTREPSQIWEDLIHEVNFLSGVAKVNGSLVSLKDLAALTRTNLSEEQLESFWAGIPELAGSYELKNGLIIERGNNNAGSRLTSVDQAQEKKARAESYARYARDFASLCNSEETKLIAISGSTSYQSPSATDDLDIFCITRPDHLWLFLTKSLLLARFLHVFRRNEPRICFSYVVDENFVEKEFLPARDALFARDALTTIVVHGREFYEELLKKSSWISSYFPHLYQRRTNALHHEGVASEKIASARSQKFLNILLRVLVGNYIAFKSAMLNRKLRKQRKLESLFSTKIGPDHCIFESVRYSKLKAMYLKLNETGRPSSEERFELSAGNRATQNLPETRQTETLKLITIGRITRVPHVAELRFTHLDGSFFVLASSASSDWVLNALAQGKCKAKMGEAVYQVRPNTAGSLEKTQVLESFRRKYGSRVLDQWYKDTQACLRLDSLGPPVIRGATRGENDTLVCFREWKNQGNNYYQSVRDAFDSASEEYDYTISHNYINSWIRKRSIIELHRIANASDVLLEIGCGTGSEAIQISRRVRGIVATDISEKMLDLLERKVKAKRLDHKVIAAKARASEISTVKELLPEGSVRVAYSFNGALNCEPDIDKVPSELSKVVRGDGYFLCSIRNTLCLPEALSHSLVLQFDKTATRKGQPTMVSVGGMDIPSCYYSPSRFANIFRPQFRVKKIIGLPAFLPPAYLSDYYLRTGKARLIPEKLELILGDRFPFNRLGDQTLFVFQKV